MVVQVSIIPECHRKREGETAEAPEAYVPITLASAAIKRLSQTRWKVKNQYMKDDV